MNKIFSLTLFTSFIFNNINLVSAQSNNQLFLAYPPNNHQTNAEQIFLIGTASPEGQVLVNGQPIQRSKQGHFAPSFPLKVGENQFILRYQDQEIKLMVNRTVSQAENNQVSLFPNTNIARLPGELICFTAIAPPKGNVSVNLANQTIPLFPSEIVQLPNNSAVLISENQPKLTNINQYQGCGSFSEIGNLGYPIYRLNLEGKSIEQQAAGQIEILSLNAPEVVEIITENGVTRTGAGTDYSRLTPLPKGTRSSVTGREDMWLRLDYGAWIKQEETRTIPNAIPPRSLIRGITAKQVSGATEINFPLQVPVPISVKQTDDSLTLTLYYTTAQTDTIKLSDDPVIKRLDWQQVNPDQVEYIFQFKSAQPWGYTLRYEGSNLILSIRHQPEFNHQDLTGIKILIDPGHGGKELGARGPTGYPEKDVNLVVSKLLAQELINRGATVYLTRESDVDVSLEDRVKMINNLQPHLALSIHYNALPDDGDAINTAGIGIFWYHPQAHNLAVFLQDFLVTKLNRPNYGVYWNNLALTRPHSTISILLELGFMINPDEFEWVINPQEQEKLATAIAEGITTWLKQVNR